MPTVLHSKEMKVCFVYDPEGNERYLDIIRKMTPNRSGVWKDMVAVTNISDADWCVVIDSTSARVPDDRTLYISAHPKMEGYDGYCDLSGKQHKLDNSETFGFGEWWLKHDYDYLCKLEKPPKSDKTVYILSDASGGYGRSRRKDFASVLEQKGVDVYGRIKGVGKGELGENTRDGYWFGKESLLCDAKYSVEVDVGPCRNYFSERVFDSVLMWCKPLYWGGTNVEKYLPSGSFQYIDIYGDGSDVINPEPVDYDAIAEARQLLLNKYQLWPRVYEYIKSR